MNKRIIVVLIAFCIFSFAQQRDSIVRVGACATPGVAWGVFIQGTYAFVADVGGVTSIDIFSPSSPNVLDFLNQTRCEASGIYLKDTLGHLNAAFAGPSFTVIDITNPSSLTRVSWVEVPAYGGDIPKGIFVIDSLVYFADGSAGFLIINISDLLSPTILCTLDTPGRVIDLFVRDTLAYLADLDSLLIVNVSDPYNPVIIGHIGIAGGGAYDVWVSGDYAFITEEDWFGGQGKVNMVDISDPTAPFLVDQISMAATPYGLFVVSDKIYVAADDWWEPPKKQGEGRADIEGGIRIIHWQEPDSMNLLVTFDTPGRCRDIFMVDSFIYIAAWDSFMIYKYVSTGVAEEIGKRSEAVNSFYVSPNPFSYQTTISFVIQMRSFVSVEIYDALGRRIKTLAGGYFVPGYYQVKWDGSCDDGLQAARGVYYVKIFKKAGSIRNEKEAKIMYIKR